MEIKIYTPCICSLRKLFALACEKANTNLGCAQDRANPRGFGFAGPENSNQRILPEPEHAQGFSPRVLKKKIAPLSIIFFILIFSIIFLGFDVEGASALANFSNQSNEGSICSNNCSGSTINPTENLSISPNKPPEPNKNVPEDPLVEPRPSKWFLINNGNPINTADGVYQYESAVSTIRTNKGILFNYKSETYGSVLGRFNELAKKWEYWDGKSWSDDSDVIPESISHSMGFYQEVKMFKHPEISDGLLGIAVSQFKMDKGTMDTHGAAISFEFDGQDFRQWSGDADYKSFFFRSVIDSWSGSGRNFDFDFNQESKKGLAIGTIGKYTFSNPPYKRQLTAALYDYNDNEQSWLRWDNGSWIDGDTWPNSDVFSGQSAWVLNPDIEDASIHEYERPLVTNIKGTNDFLVTFIYDKINIASAIYSPDDSGNPRWHWWSDDGWKSGGAYEYSSGGTSSIFKKREQISLGNQKVSLIFIDKNKLYDSVYTHINSGSNVEGNWKEPEVISDNVVDFLSAKDKDNTIWVVYKDIDSNVYLAKKPKDGNWSQPKMIYYLGESTKLGGFEIMDNEIPLLFIIKTFDNGEKRLYAISEPDSYWDSSVQFIETSNSVLAPLNESLIKYNSTLDISGSGVSGWVGDTGQLAIDDDGYLYAPQSFLFSTIVINTSADFESSKSKQWGNFAGYFHFPGGVDIYEKNNKVFISNRLVGVNGGSSLLEQGFVTIWDYGQRDIRNEDLFANSFGSAGGKPTDVYSYGEQRFAYGLAWPGDVTVDDERGLLIVSDSANNKLKIYDIENTVDFNGSESGYNFPRDTFILNSISQEENKNNVRTIVQELIDNGFLGSFIDGAGKERLYWIGKDGEVVRDFVRGLPEWDALTSDIYKGRVLKLLSNSFKAYRDQPQFLYDIGGEGSALGEFEFPQGHDIGPDGALYVVDSENNRIQKFVFNEISKRFEAVLSWGSRGKGEGEFLSPIGVSVDKIYNLVFVTDPINNRIQVFDHNGEFISEFGSWAKQNKEQFFKNNLGVETDGSGNIFISNGKNIEKFNLVDNFPDVVSTVPSEVFSLNYDANITATDDWGIKRIRIMLGNETLLDNYLDYNRSATESLLLNFSSYGSWNLTVIVEDFANQTTVFEEVIQVAQQPSGFIGGGGGGGRSSSSGDNRQPLSQNTTNEVEFLSRNSCSESWICEDWSSCIDGVRIRECHDVNNCGTVDGKPLMRDECAVEMSNGLLSKIKTTAFALFENGIGKFSFGVEKTRNRIIAVFFLIIVGAVILIGKKSF